MSALLNTFLRFALSAFFAVGTAQTTYQLIASAGQDAHAAVTNGLMSYSKFNRQLLKRPRRQQSCTLARQSNNTVFY
ncbi:hypothetical protein BH10BDE1_BH10BDE1_23760 [soil metagenome]